MRVLFVCPFVPWPLVNGGKIRTYNLIRAVAAHAEVHVRVLHEPDEAADTRDALAPICASLEFFDRTLPSAAKRLFAPKLERWFHSTHLVERVQRDLDGGHFGLVHLDELLLARVVAPGHPVPIVQHHHKLDTVLYSTLSAGEGPKRFFDLWKLTRLERESTRRYRNHLLCSHGDAEILRTKYGALDVGVVPSGFDPELFRPSQPPIARDPDRLIYLGSMDYGPNIDGVEWFVREVLPLVRRERPRTALDIVGGSPTPRVTALANDHVRIVGRVPEVVKWLEQAATMIVPLRIGGGTRLKIVEALALATPVVSTTVGAEGLGLVGDEHLRLADNAESFARTLVYQLAHPDDAAAMAARGRDYVHGRYRWDALAEELADYWERVAFSGKLSPSR